MLKKPINNRFKINLLILVKDLYSTMIVHILVKKTFRLINQDKRIVK